MMGAYPFDANEDPHQANSSSNCSQCGLDAQEWLHLLAERDRLRAERNVARAKVLALEAELISLRSRDDSSTSRRLTQPFAPATAFLPRNVQPSSPRALHRHPDSNAPDASFDPPHQAAQRVHSEMDGIDFGAVSRLSPAQLDGLPYGLVTLDAAGRIIHYNDTESRLVGLAPSQVIGRYFFEEVAPCTRVRDFKGRFEELVQNPGNVRVQTFDFVFRFASGHQQVSIVMTPSRTRGQYHVAMLRRGPLT